MMDVMPIFGFLIGTVVIHRLEPVIPKNKY